ncbi:Transport protein particle subunit [Lachnellula subtilissima]|uniref:Trafficking protein particle complex subunit n=1 Tax=Lachnellula subtilissima TaxID=602034 RepID=A0A8H8RXX3_9HELO|nr:Transport protein particle subunit [Lachnellula subtilissima]
MSSFYILQISFPTVDTPQICTVVYALIIINKAGGLVYQRDFTEGLNKLSVNDYLVLAGTFHGVHAITTRLNPLHPPNEPPSGIEVMETEHFRLQCFQTLTGTKFLLFTEPFQPNTDKIVARIYELYADYVMKNPFYSLEMPIRSEGWERRLVREMRVLNSR